MLPAYAPRVLGSVGSSTARRSASTSQRPASAPGVHLDGIVSGGLIELDVVHRSTVAAVKNIAASVPTPAAGDVRRAIRQSLCWREARFRWSMLVL